MLSELADRAAGGSSLFRTTMVLDDVVVGSASALKLGAVAQALAWQLGHSDARRVQGLAFDSAVDEQPVTRQETERGASHRAREARRRFMRLCGGAAAMAGGLTLLSACDDDDAQSTPDHFSTVGFLSRSVFCFVLLVGVSLG